MHQLMNLIASVTTMEVAFGIAFALLLALFLIPMYVLHCTGRNLLANNVGRVAHREWMLGSTVVVYSRWPISKGWRGCKATKKTSRSCTLTMGTVQIELVRLCRSQAPIYRATYRNAKKHA